MKRRHFIAVAVGWPIAARAQRKIPVIAVLSIDSAKPSPVITGLLDALRDKGLVAGRDFQLDDRVTADYGNYAEIVADVVRAKVALIVTNGTTAAVAAAKATKEVPIIMIGGADPVGLGLVSSLSRPGGNVTGVYTLASPLNAKRVELLKELNPSLSSFGTLLAANVGNPGYMRDTEQAARALGLQARFLTAQTGADIDGAIAEFARLRVGGLVVAPGTLLISYSAAITEAAAKHRMPAVYPAQRFADAGGSLIYSPSGRKNQARAATYVQQILKGARPAELPIQQSSDVDLIVNLRTAKALGIAIPPSLLVRADRVIE